MNSFVSDFSEEVWRSLKSKGIEGVGVSGSFARGDFSKGRPDINLAVFAKDPSSNLLLSIGQIASSLHNKYSKEVIFRPDLHPERFVFPWGRDKTKPEVFFKIAVFDFAQKNSAFPFGRPGFVLESHRSSMKMLYGKNYLENIKISSSNEEVLKGCNHMYGIWSKQIKLTPLSYDLENDVDLFFNESLSWGKVAIQQYAWVQGLKNGLDYSKQSDRKQIFEKVGNKKLLRTFFDLAKKDIDAVNLVLDARLKYDEWKFDKDKAIEVYKASSNLLSVFSEETEKLVKKNLSK